MADLRTFSAVTDSLARLSLRYGAGEVLEVVKAWVTYMHGIEEIVARYEVPDTIADLIGGEGEKDG